MKSDFCVAVHALVYLYHKKGVVSSEELADNICTNAARVRKVMAHLKTADLVQTKEGKEGGYQFILDAGAVNLAEVAEALKIHFAEMNWYSGDQEKNCLVSSGMAGIMENLLEELHTCCMKKLTTKTIADINEEIFRGI